MYVIIPYFSYIKIILKYLFHSLKFFINKIKLIKYLLTVNYSHIVVKSEYILNIFTKNHLI